MPSQARGYAMPQRVSAPEDKALSRNRLERLKMKKDYSDAVKIMVEAGYGNEQIDNRKSGAENLESILSSELLKTYDLIGEMIPDPMVLNLFKKRYDYLNAKLIIKAEALKVDVSKSLTKLGNIDPVKLLKLISVRKLNDLPEIFREAITAGLDEFNISGDPQMIDFIMDKANYSDMSEDA